MQQNEVFKRKKRISIRKKKNKLFSTFCNDLKKSEEENWQVNKGILNCHHPEKNFCFRAEKNYKNIRTKKRPKKKLCHLIR